MSRPPVAPEVRMAAKNVELKVESPRLKAKSKNPEVPAEASSLQPSTFNLRPPSR